MKKETLKEFGKLFFDFAKIVLAIALVTPIVKGEGIAIVSIGLIVALVAIGIYIFNKGAKDD